MEHVERTGVHSGDSISVYPPHSLPQDVIDRLIDYTNRITRALKVVGLVNIQYAYDGKSIYVIEVNPRASRTVPIISKVTGVPMVKLAVAAMLGHKLAESEYGTGLFQNRKFTAIKMPVFSNAKLTDVDIALGPEMKSTGEILAIDETYEKAIYKGFLATGVHIPTEGGIYVSLRDPEKTAHTAEIIRGYREAGFDIYASSGTGRFLEEHGVMPKDIADETDAVKELVAGGHAQIVINVPKVANRVGFDAFGIRRYATERNLPVLTCMDTAAAFLIALKKKQQGVEPIYASLEDYTREDD
jgi:carbamoyl-phosphate synthase large subunit